MDSCGSSWLPLPFEIGPFRRTLMVSSPDFPAVEPKQVSVTGRVRGVFYPNSAGENPLGVPPPRKQ